MEWLSMYAESEENQNYKCINWILRNGYHKCLILIPDKTCEDSIKSYMRKRRIKTIEYGELGHGRSKEGIVVDVKIQAEFLSQLDAVIIMNSSRFVNLQEISDYIRSRASLPMLCLDYKIPLKPIKELKKQPRAKISWDKFNKHLVDRQVYTQFLDTFEIANEEIDIISPWISENVLDEDMIRRMEGCLQRGVKINIVYGIGNDGRMSSSEKNADMLKRRFAMYGHMFRIQKQNTHVKLVLCDKKYMLYGSYNFLSYKGTYDGNDVRQESVEYVVSEQKILEMRRRYFR